MFSKKHLIFGFLGIVLTTSFLFFKNTTEAAPGNVSTSILMWLKADTGTSCSTNGCTVGSWTDQSGQGKNGTGANVSYLSNGMNFNPSMSFNGTNSYFSLPSGFANIDQGFSVFAVADMGTTNVREAIINLSASGGVQAYELGRGTTNNLRFNLTSGSIGDTPSDNDTTTAAGSVVNSTQQIYSTVHRSLTAAPGASGFVYIDGKTELSAISPYGIDPITRSFNSIGRAFDTSSTLTRYLSGEVAEIVIYNYLVSATDRSKIQSYLALKYGITLNQSPATNYVNSANSNIWSSGANSSYNDDIAGIGRDDSSPLNQKQSKSQNSDDILTIGRGTIATTNALNTNTFSANNTFLTWGNNDGTTGTWTTTGAPLDNRKRINRVWKLQETLDTGVVRVSVPDNSSAATAKLTTEVSKVYLYLATSTNFATGATEIEMTLNGTEWQADVNIDTTVAPYMTFMTQEVEVVEIKGTVYTDRGVTNIGLGKKVRLLYNGADTGLSTTTDAVGAYAINYTTISTTTVATGGIFTVYLDDETENGVTIASATSTGMIGVDIYQNYLIPRNDNSTTITNTNLDTADNVDPGTSSDDISLIYNVAAGNLNVVNTTGGLYVPASKTFAPSGAVINSGNYYNYGTTTMTTHSTNVAGNWFNNTTAIYTPGTGTIIFDGTTAQTVTSGGDGLGRVTNSNLLSTVTQLDNVSTINLTTDVGSIWSLAGRNLTVTGIFSNEGFLRLQGAETTTLTQDIDSGMWQYVGNNNGLATSYTIKDFGAVDYCNISINSSDANDTYANPTTKNIACNFSIVGGIATNAAAVTIDASFNQFGGTYTAPASSLSIGTNFSRSSGTFNHNNGQVSFIGGAASHTINGSTSFYDLLIFDGITDNSSQTITIQSGTTQTIANSFILNGQDADDRVLLRSSTPGTNSNFSFTGTATFSTTGYLDIMDNHALDSSSNITLPINPANSIDSGNSTGWFGSSNEYVSISKVADGFEPSTDAQFLLTLSAAATTTFDIGYTITGTAINGTDYTTITGTTTITAGTSTAGILIDVIDDLLIEGSENVILTITGTDYGLFLASSTASTSTATIGDDDFAPPAWVAISKIIDAAEPATHGQFLITSEIVATTTINVLYSISGTGSFGVDYSGPVGTIAIVAGTSTVAIPVTVIDDVSIEGTETVILTIIGTDNGIFSASTTADSATVNILDNDVPTPAGVVSISSTTDAAEPATDGLFTIYLTVATNTSTDVGYTVSGTAGDGVDFTTIAATTTIPANATFTTISIPVIDDLISEFTETVIITLTAIDNALMSLGTTVASINIIDNEVAGFTLSTTTVNLVDGGATGNFTIVLNTEPESDVVITILTSDLGVTTVNPTTITFTAANWNIPQSVTVIPVSDADFISESATFTISIDDASSNNLYDPVANQTVSVTVLDGVDDDGDGVPTSVEDDGFNGGDGNGDGILDSTQQHVSGALNPVTGGYTTLEATGVCTFIVQNAFVAESSLATQDATYSYPVGLVDFRITCPSPGASTTVSLYYTTNYDTSAWLYKKYNSVGQVYSNISPRVTFSATSVGGTTVTKASYVVTDGEVATDEDGVADSQINDPSGPAVAVPVTTTTTTSGGGGGSVVPYYPITQPNTPTILQQVVNTTVNKLPALIGGGEPNVPAEFSNYVCKRYLRSYIKLGADNKKEDVLSLQNFLNVVEGKKLNLDGTYDADDEAAVRRFQNKYKELILYPWGIYEPTGWVFKTTTAKINLMMCQGDRTGPYFTEYLKLGDESLESVKVQDFLNIIFAPTSGYPTNGLQLTKTFDAKTVKKLKEYQTLYKDTVLKPWGLDTATGWFYQTTRKSANLLIGHNEGEVKLDNGTTVK